MHKLILVILITLSIILGIRLFLNEKVTTVVNTPEPISENTQDTAKQPTTVVKSEQVVKPVIDQMYLIRNYSKELFKGTYIVVSVPKQELYTVNNGKVLKTYKISTAKKGVGNIMNSLQTPLGLHQIASKIGANAPIGTIIKAGVVTDKTTEIIIEHKSIGTDLLITRVMPLTGLEPGINRGGKVDSYNRGIMIHGTPEEGLIGEEVSHGCIRMINTDIIELFNSIPKGTKVLIENEL